MSGADEALGRLRVLAEAAAWQVNIATSLIATVEPAWDDPAVFARYEGTSHAGWAFVRVRVGIRRQAALALSRLWDKTGERRSGCTDGGDASARKQNLRMLDVARELKKAAVREALVADKVRRLAQIADGAWGDAARDPAVARFVARDPDADRATIGARAQASVDRALDDFHREWQQHEGALAGPLRSLKRLRDESMAHTEITPHPAQPPPEGLAVAHLRAVLTASQALVSRACGIANVPHLAFEETHRAHLQDARAFWSIPLRAERHTDD